MAGPDTTLEGSIGSRAIGRVRRRLLEAPYRTAAATVAALSGLVVLWLATDLFPYHSRNHDEAVYLLQASMLLDGRFELYAGDLAASFRPWFFVQDGGRLYPKYAPVPAGIFAIGTALGEPRLSLGLVAAGNAALVYALTAAGWDRRTGVVAALALLGAPLFLLSSSVFLPYAPTFLLNLLFAFAYVRAVRRRSAGYAVLAGVAVGLAAFGRPYTALLFAAPFVVHACYVLADGLYRRSRAAQGRESWSLRSRALVLGTVAALGAAFVLVALAYNRALTGSALTFPYEAFAPRDGPGFGRREILGHSIEYTPELAVRTNAYVVRYLLTRWIALGPVGAALALVGLVVHLRDGRPSKTGVVRLEDGTVRWLFVAVACSVVVGNVPFWGNYNALATMTDPTDGLLSHFGPFYHFDLLLPLSAFAAAGGLAIGGRVRSVLDGATVRRPLGEHTPSTVAEFDGATARRLLVVALVLVSLPVGVAAEAAVLEPPVDRNAAYTEKYESAYEPFAETDLEGALVFLPTPYGDWLGHPFQPLRNGPGLDGETVYALDRGPEPNWDVIDAYPERELYRYTYRGEWTPDPDERVVPKLERLERRSGERLDGRVSVGVPPNVQSASVAVTNGSDTVRYDVGPVDDRDEIAVDWALTANETVAGAPTTETEPNPNATASVGTPDEGPLSLLVTLTGREGSTLTYRLDLSVRTDGDRVEVVWPAVTKACQLTTDCGTEGTYLPDRPDEHLDGVSIEAALETNESAREEGNH